MSLTTVLQQLADDLVVDSEINSICARAWDKNITVFRRVPELYIPKAEELPMIQIHSGTRYRDGHYMVHGVDVVVMAGTLQKPDTLMDVNYSADEEEAENLAERVEEVTVHSFDSQGVAALPAQGNEDIITGPCFIAGYSYEVQLKNVINPEE